MTMPSLRARARRFTLALAGACMLTGGCSQGTRAPSGGVDTPPTMEQPAGFVRLRDLARVQAAHPVRSVMATAPPPGLDPAQVEARPDPSPEARTPLDATIARLGAQRPDAPAAIAVALRDSDAALHLYITGREKLMSRDVAGAIADLKKATELDPGAGEPWRELAEAQLAAGLRTDARASFEKALSCGLEDPRVLERLSRSAADRGDHAAAAVLLARASLASPERSDPLLPAVIEVALSRALSAQGYTTAARDAMLRAVGRSARLSASTRYGEEFGAIYRRQGDLWREAGDSSCRLGQYDQALQAYEKAAQLPTLDGRSLAPRLVYASLRAGRPAAAALAVLEEIADQGGRVSDEQAQLLRVIADAGPTGPEIARALDAFGKSLPTPVPPSVAGGLARAAAAVTPERDRARLLREHLSRFPRDERAMIALIQTAPDAAGAAGIAAALVAQTPESAPRAAEALLGSRFDAQALEQAVVSAGPAGARPLLAVRLLLLRGWQERAAELARSIPVQGKFGPEAALARVEAGIWAGDHALAQEGLRSLLQLPGAEGSKARALSWFQRSRDALALLEPRLIGPPADAGARLEDLILAADLAGSLASGDDAERWLREAAALDPYDDRAPSRLLALYGPGGAKADSSRLNQTIRELRRTIPESRTLRGARVKELQRRGLLEQAENEARALAEEEPADGSAVDLLLSVWNARAARDGPEVRGHALAWLELQLERRPASAPILAALSVVLAASGEAAQAESRIRAVLSAGGGPDVSRVLEKVLRDDLKRPQEADALTLARLEHRGRLPAESLELADCYARGGDDAKAVRTILAAFPEQVAVLPDQAARLLHMTGPIALRALTDSDEDRRNQAAALFDLLVSRGLPFTPELHDRRLQLLALIPDADAARILEAATLTAIQYPHLGVAPYLRASSALSQANRGVTALVLISRAAEQVRDAGVDLFIEWTRVIASVGTAAHAREMIERADAAGRLRELVDRFEGPAPADAPASNLRAEAAYFLGHLFSAGKRPDEADGAYELALQYDPHHAWSLNNLGYSILERGGDISRASDLLERAHDALPEEGSITDSLGWLRYKQAIIEDRRDAAGVVSMRGAVTLLQSAAMTERGRNNPTILNHLGDALWLAGRAEQALRYWEMSEQLAARLLIPRPQREAAQADANTLSPAAADEYRAIRESAAAKRRAAMDGREVRVAPQISDPDPKPAVRRDSSAPEEPVAEPALPAGRKTVEH